MKGLAVGSGIICPGTESNEEGWAHVFGAKITEEPNCLEGAILILGLNKLTQ